MGKHLNIDLELDISCREIQDMSMDFLMKAIYFVDGQNCEKPIQP